MKKIIEIDIMELDNLVEKYNREKVSKELLAYIIEASNHFSKNDSVKIIVNNHTMEKNKCIPLIIAGLKDEYDKSRQRHIRTNLLQIIYLIAGLIALSISTQIGIEIIREVVLISGWVLIWTIIELEIFSDVAERKRRKQLKNLLNSEFIEKNNL